MSSTPSRNRNQRNNPYLMDDQFVAFHRSGAGAAWRWRTELTILTIISAALWRLALLITLTWAALALAALVAGLLGLPVTRRFITARFWCVLARHRLQRLCYEARLHTTLRPAAADPVDPPDQGRRTHPPPVPRRDLRRRLRRPHRRAARRLLRPRRPGHP